MSLPLGPGPETAKVPGRGFWPLRDLPTALWLILVVVVALVHRLLPAPRWLLIHLLLLGALSHAILVWSQYFAAALLKRKVTVAERHRQSLRLSLMNGGALVVVSGVLAELWPMTLAGALLVAAAAGWHGLWLYHSLRGSLPSPFAPSVRYYIAAACFLPVGAGLGTWISSGLASPLHERLTLAHALVNLLGWVGLTVAGTLITLWPTMLRTRMAPNAAPRLRRALPVLVIAVLLAAGGAAAGHLLLAAAGVLGYLAGLGMTASPFIHAAKAKPPRSFAALSVLSAVCWWVGTLLWALYALATSSDWMQMGRFFNRIAPYLAAGFAAQILLGALSYLVPVVLGGGPRPVRAAATVLDRGAAWRLSMANAALLACALPVSSLVRVLCSVLYFGAMASFLPLLFSSMKAHRVAKREVVESAGPPRLRERGPVEPDGASPPGQRMGQAAAGLMAVVLVIAIGVALDPAAAGVRLPDVASTAQQADEEANAPVKTVQMEARDMRFTPNRIEVEAGTRLVIELANTDPSQVHDLVLANGVGSGRLAPGQSATVDVGVITADMDGWCSIVGHKQMGMVLQIVAVGAPASAAPSSAASEGAHEHDQQTGQQPAAAAPDLQAQPADGFSAHNPVLDPLPADTGKPVVHKKRFTVSELEAEVSPGFTQNLWTFNGAAPGPVLHGRVGDSFEITLHNDGTMGHSIDFHAGSLAPDEPMRTIAPGEELTYTFTATMSGIWMYHCATAPMSAHIANGMYGAVIIEPEDLPEVDKSFVMVQSEYYLGSEGQPVDVGKIAGGNPDLVVFNGYANQYSFDPLQVATGERLRIWVLSAGPNRPSSFHVIGGQFDTVYAEGAYQLDARDENSGGSQALALAPAQGGFVELQLPEAGNYPFVTHYMSDGEKGARGVIKVSDPK
ncbi:multicopper oxidase domain-containing protein [Glutamicibacter nicotianae]